VRLRILLLAALLAPAGCAVASGLDALHGFIAATATAQGEFQQKVAICKRKSH
jgi:hypothetical protein